MTFFNDFEGAEQVLIKAERKDLAISLMTKIGNFERVMDLIIDGAGSDALVNQTYDQLGQYFADSLDWDKSAHYYGLAKNYEGMLETYPKAGNYEGLANMVDELEDKAMLT